MKEAGEFGGGLGDKGGRYLEWFDVYQERDMIEKMRGQDQKQEAQAKANREDMPEIRKFAAEGRNLDASRKNYMLSDAEYVKSKQQWLESNQYMKKEQETNLSCACNKNQILQSMLNTQELNRKKMVHETVGLLGEEQAQAYFNAMYVSNNTTNYDMQNQNPNDLAKHFNSTNRVFTQNSQLLRSNMAEPINQEYLNYKLQTTQNNFVNYRPFIKNSNSKIGVEYDLNAASQPDPQTQIEKFYKSQQLMGASSYTDVENHIMFKLENNPLYAYDRSGFGDPRK